MSDSVWSWFAAAPERFWWVALPCGVALVAGVFFRRLPGWGFLGLLALSLLAFRWPAVVHGVEFNRDESQMLAAAATLKYAPVYWRDVDAHAVGPLDVYPLTLLGALGLPLDYLTARSWALVAIWLSLFGLYRLLREAHGEALARTGTVVAAGYFCLLRQYDLIGYSSETVAAGLIGLGLAGVWIGIGRGSTGLVFWGGLAFGAVPWAKIQGAPIALAIGVGAAIFLWRNWAADAVRRRRLFCWAGAGLVSTTFVFSIMLTVHGLWSEWTTAYLRAGLDYTSTAVRPMLEIFSIFASVEPLGYYAFILPLFAVVVLFFGAVLFHGGEGRLLALTLGGATVAAFVAVSLPGRIFPHYLILTVVPFAGFAATLFGAFLAGPAVAARIGAKPWLAQVYLGLFLAGTLLPELHWTFRADSPRYEFEFKPGMQHLVRSRTAAIIRGMAREGDTLAMWGWEPSQYVQTGLPQATREAHSERLISNYPLQPYYRARYLADLKRSAPRFFIDAVGPGRFTFSDRRTQAHEIWPELAAWIAANYQLADDTDGMRLYLSNRSLGR